MRGAAGEGGTRKSADKAKSHPHPTSKKRRPGTTQAVEKRKRKPRHRSIYFNFFFGRSWLVWPHFFLRQFLARGGRRA